MTAPVSKARRYELDALRIIACLFVVVIHTANRLPWGEMSRATWWGCNLYSALVRSAVPLFLMISGANFLSRPEPPEWKVLLKKYVLRLVLLYALWRLLYSIDSCGIASICSLSGWKQILTTEPKYHLWFLPKMITAYLLLPVLWLIAREKDGKYLDGCLLGGIVLYFLSQTLRNLPLGESLSDLLTAFEYPLNSFLLYMLLGYRLSSRECKVGTLPLLLGFILSVMAAAGLNGWLSLRKGGLDDTMFNLQTVFSMMEAICVFLLFRRWGQKSHFGCRKLLTELSAGTLGVYLLHVFLLEHLQQWLGDLLSTVSPLLSIPVLSLAVFGICMAISCLIRRIPWVGKWIM